MTIGWSMLNTFLILSGMFIYTDTCTLGTPLVNNQSDVFNVQNNRRHLHVSNLARQTFERGTQHHPSNTIIVDNNHPHLGDLDSTTFVAYPFMWMLFFQSKHCYRRYHDSGFTHHFGRPEAQFWLVKSPLGGLQAHMFPHLYLELALSGFKTQPLGLVFTCFFFGHHHNAIDDLQWLLSQRLIFQVSSQIVPWQDLSLLVLSDVHRLWGRGPQGIHRASPSGDIYLVVPRLCPQPRWLCLLVWPHLPFGYSTNCEIWNITISNLDAKSGTSPF